MAETVADHVLSRLRQWGVDRVFGYPGDGINGIIAAFGHAENSPTFTQARHEEMAAFEAVGCAKFSGRVAVCMATSGPGAIHLLNGLYDAKLDHVPVVAIVGQTARTAMGGYYQQEVDLLALFKDVAGEYVHVVTVPEQLLPDFPNAGYAQSLGLLGIRVDAPDEVAAAWKQALSADRPVVIEFLTDPAVPPIPPHATLAQIEASALSVVKGDADRWDVVKEGVMTKVQEFLPGTKGDQ